MNTEDRQVLLDYLSQYELMSLATVDKKGNLWSATVYYLYDRELNLYFLSPVDSLHCRNIEENPQVSIAIAASDQKPKDHKIGFQLRGEVERIKAPPKVHKVIGMWNARFKDGLKVSYTTMMNEWKSRFYKIRPTFIKFFNEELYGEEGMKEWKL